MRRIVCVVVLLICASALLATPSATMPQKWQAFTDNGNGKDVTLDATTLLSAEHNAPFTAMVASDVSPAAAWNLAMTGNRVPLFAVMSMSPAMVTTITGITDGNETVFGTVHIGSSQHKISVSSAMTEPTRIGSQSIVTDIYAYNATAAINRNAHIELSAGTENEIALAKSVTALDVPVHYISRTRH